MQQKIYQQHQRRYLQLEYDQKTKQAMKQQLEVTEQLQVLKNNINPMEFELLNKHLERLKQQKKMEIKRTHNIKINKLSKGEIKLDTIDPKKVVHNISSRILNEDEESILAKGLQFCIENKIKDSLDFKTEIEQMAYNILKQLHKPEEKTLDTTLTECIHRAADQALKINKNKKIINVNKFELIALKQLMKDKTIVIMKADKGSSCVVMDKEWYKTKVKELLSTGTSFTKMNDKDERGILNTIEHVVKKMEGKLDYRLNELLKAKKLSQNDYDYIRCTGSRCSVMFCNPKVHKEGMPLRPIISTTNSYNYRLAKYVDDTFIILNGKESDVEQLIEFVNQLHPKLRFTRELEKNYELPFLDVKVIKQRTKFETTVYKKKTHTGQLLHWQSCQAKKYKIGLIRTLTHRALNICSSKQLLDQQCELILKTLTINGYPINLVKRKINYTIDQHHRTNEKTNINKKVFIPLTYYGNETIIMSNKIKSMIESLFPTTQIIFGYKKGLTLAKLFTKNFKGKDPMETNVIYKLSCNKCEQVYIGQTKLNVTDRMKQHKDGLRKPDISRAADHMINNKDHVIDFSKPEIIGRDAHKKRREIKETFLSLQHQHAYNKISHELMIFSN
ncbi:unnamed protein product [Adineta steineri]|uniref:GIY-YIG domain-containing protein n=1 Tax=Adineta steineri TaxID=433720 RepID=A0A819GIX9_9BILA|nr:unnamed protein product [Adineta steineri]